MERNQELAQCYANYLSGGETPTTASRMVESMESAGLLDEAKLLYAGAIEGKQEMVIGAKEPQRATINVAPPQEGKMGDLWFDLVELNLCTFVEPIEGWARSTGGWFSRHPVYDWQFQGFLEVVQWKQILRSKTPILESNRPIQSQTLGFANGVSAFDARTYALWFGKALIGEYMACAKRQLNLDEFFAMFPDGFRSWSMDNAYGNEGEPLAYGHGTINHEDFFELMEMTLPDSQKLRFSEWESDRNVLFSTYLPSTGLMRSPGGVSYPYAQLLNDSTKFRNVL